MAERPGPPITHSRPEKDEGDCDDCESPAEPDAPNILANTPVLLLTLALEFEELPAAEAPAVTEEVVVVESCGVIGCGCERVV